MSRAPARFTEADVKRALRAAAAAKASVAIEIAPDGTIRLVPVPPSDRTAAGPIGPRRKIVL